MKNFKIEMRKTLHDLLISADEKGQWEYPKGFKWNKRMKILQEIKSELDEVFDFQLDIDCNVQDASFTTDIGLLDESSYNRKTQSGLLNYIFSFRFSNFGNFYIVDEINNSNKVYTNKIDKCIEILNSKGFILINSSELNEEYNGINKPFEKELTWWTRYFDYL